MPEACERAFNASGRLQKVAQSSWPGGYSFRPFEVRTTSRKFSYSRRASGGPEALPKASNKTVLWTPNIRQVVISGVLQGRKQGDVRGASAVSRLGMWKTTAAVASSLAMARLEPVVSAPTYVELKASGLLENRRRVKRDVVDRALEGWIPNVADDFSLDSPDPHR